MARSFTCLGCGLESSTEGKRSWTTKALSIITVTWFFEFWYAYCPTCMAKINALSVFLAAAIALFVGGALLYGSFAA
jgi:hypothetical protein